MSAAVPLGVVCAAGLVLLGQQRWQRSWSSSASPHTYSQMSRSFQRKRRTLPTDQPTQLRGAQEVARGTHLPPKKTSHCNELSLKIFCCCCFFGVCFQKFCYLHLQSILAVTCSVHIH